MSPIDRLNLTFDMRTIFGLAILGGPLVAIMLFALQLRQDVRANANAIGQERADRVAADAAIRVDVAKTQQGVEEFRRAQLIYCTELRRSNGRRELPDANC